MGLRFKILGRTALRFGDRQFDDRWGHSKLRGMLAALLLHGGRGVSIAELIDWVWPDGKAPDNLIDTSYSYASRIRHWLRRMESPPNLASADGIYRIEVAQDEVDFFAFRVAVEKARAAGGRGDHERARQVLEAALGLWTDHPLADLHGERAVNWRLWAETDLWLPAQDLLLQELAAMRRFDQILHRLADLPATHQASLPLVKRKLEALYGQGRNGEATGYLLRMRKQLLSEGDHDEADDLLRFNDSLEVGPVPPVTAVSVAVETPHLLRRDIQDFTGRDDLLRQLDEVTAGDLVSGVVALDGEAGVGKTALAVHWAHRAVGRYPGGVLYADLGGFSDGGARVEASKIVDTFLAALGFPPERIPTTAGRSAKLRELLADRGAAAALLDDAFDSAQVAPLLDCLSPCLVVVTSRRRLSGLGRRGATNVTVAPLSYRESKAWLVRRLGVRLDGAQGAADMLAELCGGNMLALRVVAQHVATAPHVPVGELVEELRDSHTLLGLGDDGDGPDGSVRAALSCSYRVLGPDEQRVFRLVGLFPGTDLSVDVAALLAGKGRKETERSLGILVNAHLVTRESRERYRLHDLLRKYAAERIAAAEHGAERATAAERLLSYFLHTANNADSAVFPFRSRVDLLPLIPGVVPADFEDDEDAMDWCIRERVVINAIVKFASQENLDAYVPKLANVAGEIFHRLGFYEDNAANLTLGAASARKLDDIKEEGNALNNRVHMALDRGDIAAAESYLDVAERRYGEIDYQIGLAVASYHRGRLCLARGEFQHGIDLYERSLAMFRRADAEGLAVLVLHRLGEAYRRRFAFDQSESFCRDGLWRAEKLGDESAQGRCLTELALIYSERGDVATARGYAARALALHERQRDRAGAGKISNLLARLALEQASDESVERYARRGLELCRGARDSEGEATARDLLAHVFRESARHDEAAREWTLALTIFEDLADPRAASVRTKLAELPALPPIVPETRTEPLVPSAAHTRRGNRDRR